jgi:hypothetical protein
MVFLTIIVNTEQLINIIKFMLHTDKEVPAIKSPQSMQGEEPPSEHEAPIWWG